MADLWVVGLESGWNQIAAGALALLVVAAFTVFCWWESR
jgi:hypothetical protein